jgi:hypothetical protein
MPRVRLVGWLLVGCLFACGTVDDLDAEVRDLQRRTIPAGASLITATSITRDTWSVKATWEVETPMRWEEYMQSVRGRLTGFIEPTVAQFTRTVGSDTHILHVEPLGAGPPLRVRVSFQGLAG